MSKIYEIINNKITFLFFITIFAMFYVHFVAFKSLDESRINKNYQYNSSSQTNSSVSSPNSPE